MSGPFGAIAIALAFVVSLTSPGRLKLWEVLLICFGMGASGALLDFAFGTNW